jgi:heme exporter protein A
MGTSQATTPAIRLDNAAIERGGRMVLRSFSLEADCGEIIWIRGANGVGKSTLLRTIAGLLSLSAGSLQVHGSIGLTDEGVALDEQVTLEEGLRFWARLDDASNAALEKALEALDLVLLAELPVRMLSAGQRRRGALARMIASSAQIWLLDEPYNGLDQASLARLDAVIQKHVAAGGIALIASHIAPTVNVSRAISLDHPVKKAAA